MVRLEILPTLTLLLLLFTNHCHSATTPTPNLVDTFLIAHNKARAVVGVSPLQWSPSLVESASQTVRLQRDKHNCTLANLSSSQFGANQLLTGYAVVNQFLTGYAVVNQWVAENKFYDYAKNECAPDHQCGSYTQVVWKNSTELGCAHVVCPNQQDAVLAICFYNPPGNVVGERPY